MKKHRYKGLMKTISYNICGDGYDADERAEEVFEKAKKLIDKAYKKGKADGKEEVIEEVANEILNLPTKYINNFDYVSVALILNKVEQLKEQK